VPSSPDVETAESAPPSPSAHATERSGVWYPKGFWRRFSVPGSLWILLLFVLPFYVIVSVAFGTTDPIFRTPLPVYQPWWWSFSQAGTTLGKIFGPFLPTYVHTFMYVAVASALCLLIGYPVSYYVARFGGRWRTLILVLLIAPFWISYLMRMLAWRSLLTDDGYVNALLSLVHLPTVGWLQGQPVTVILGLVYGYIPYMILPLYGFLDRIDPALLEAGRDLGAAPSKTFWRVTLPLSRPAILAGMVIVTLPMFGDYYTNNMLSNSPRTNMIGNILDDSVSTSGQGPEAAVLTLVLMVLLIVPMMYYLRATAKDLAQR
jgi:spermidine/putrescine transport system permease protein